MIILSDKEILEMAHDGVFLQSIYEITRDIESLVIAKIKAQGADMLYHGRCIVDCGDYGHLNVELLKLIPVGTKLYRLPKGEKE